MSVNSREETRERAKGKKRSVAKRSLVLEVVAMLAFALLVSIVIEWIGMVFWWRDEGLNHSLSMIETEAGYLNNDFTTGVLGSSPVRVILDWADTAYGGVFEWTGIESGLRWLGETLGVYQFAMAVPAITHLFFIRLGVFVFSLPVYGLAAIVGITSGLTLRDIRRWSAGREFGRVYHLAKAAAPKMLIVGWFLYLAVPVAIHPNMIILPFAVLFGINITVMSAAYKKYL